jgi:hypothetical protein
VVRELAVRHTARLISQASLMASLSNWRACSMIGRKGIQPARPTIRPTSPTSMPVQATESLDEDLDRDHAICHSLARHYSALNH